MTVHIFRLQLAQGKWRKQYPHRMQRLNEYQAQQLPTANLTSNLGYDSYCQAGKRRTIKQSKR